MSIHALFLDLQLRVFSNSEVEEKTGTRKPRAVSLPLRVAKATHQQEELIIIFLPDKPQTLSEMGHVKKFDI